MKWLRVFRHLPRRIGHRGAFLMFLAVLNTVYGYALWLYPPPKAPTIGLTFHQWAIIWIISGFIALGGAFLHNDRIPFGVVATVQVGWAMAWLKLQYIDHVPRAWISVVVWLAFSAVTVIISTWPEDRKHRKIDVPEPEVKVTGTTVNDILNRPKERE